MNRNFSKSIAFLTLVATLTTAAITSAPSHALTQHGQAKATQVAKKKANIVQTAIASENLSTLVAAIKAAGLVDALSAKGPFTVFAPDNMAFAKLAKNPKDAKMVDAVIAKLVGNPTELANILKYHVVQGDYPSSKLKSGMVLKTLNGQKLTVSVYANGKVVLTTDSGSPVATVTKSNVMTSNGTVHIINNVLLPKTKKMVKEEKPEVKMNGTLFMKALKETGLEEAIKYDTSKKFTLLAPEDYAFNKLSSQPNNQEMVKSDLAVLFANKPFLTKVIKNHIIEGDIKAADLKNGQIVYNILGDELKVTIEGSKIYFTDVTSGKKAMVIKADEMTKSGTQHTISDVLIP